MPLVCPSVTANNAHEYRSQLEKVEPFAGRIHLDFMDGEFTSNKSVEIGQAWVPEGVKTDLHLMFQNPLEHIDVAINLNPHLVIVHAEADGDFDKLAVLLANNGVKVGVALLPKTPVSLIERSIHKIDHILIFSGDLGHFGGKADLTLVAKASEAKALKPGVEIGWDGGVNAENIKTLIHNGVDVLNVGGFIQNSERPQEAYATLKQAVKEANTDEPKTFN